LIFTYQSEFLQFVQNIETKQALNPVGTATTLITIKTLTAPLGFPGTPLTIFEGALFGYFFGTIVALIGNTLGGCLAFLLSRYVLQNYVRKKILSRHPKIKDYEQKMMKQGVTTVASLRLIPLFPFNSLNFLLGTTNISFKKYVLGSFIGMAPGTFLFVYFGDSLRTLRMTNIILAIIGIITLTFLSILYKKSSDFSLLNKIP